MKVVPLDPQKVKQIYLQIFPETPWEKSGLQYQWYGLVVEEEVISFMSQLELPEGLFWFNIATLPSYRNKGMARYMLSNMFREDQDIYLYVDKDNRPAIALYHSLGFCLTTDPPEGLSLPPPSRILMVRQKR